MISKFLFFKSIRKIKKTAANPAAKRTDIPVQKDCHINAAPPYPGPEMQLLNYIKNTTKEFDLSKELTMQFG
ncbi:MAG: hypothetical protein QM640_11585 [Niabella sp.]